MPSIDWRLNTSKGLYGTYGTVSWCMVGVWNNGGGSWVGKTVITRIDLS